MDFRFRVHGIVREAGSKTPLAGLRVRGFDKDLVFDDPLGEALTDAEGRFEIVYTDEAFRSIVDQQPDLYLQVWDAAATRELHTTRDAVRYDATADEYFEIEIPKAVLGALDA